MQRQIKFRAWDNGVMHQWNELQHTPPSGWDTERIHHMQFTGLTDKNGKDVFEGDVVNVPGGNRGNWEVRYLCGGFHICNEQHNYTITTFNSDIGANGELSNIEVIGNIYENPELVEKA